MAKVMVSLPDKLLADVDAIAERDGTSRSAVLRSFAEDALRRRSERRAAAIKEIMKRPGFGGGFGGNSAELVKESRPKWYRDKENDAGD
jgi:hypothetical protein